MKVFHRKNNRSLRVLWMLEEMGLDYEVCLVSHPAAEDAAFAAANPMLTVPAVVDGDVVLTESMAIVEYIGLRYGPTPLIPAVTDPGFPDYLEFVHYGEASLAGPVTPLIRTHYLAPDGEKTNWTTTNIRATYAKRMEKVADQLRRFPYMAGSAFTAADMSVGYAIGVGLNFGLGDGLGPAVTDYFERITARPAYMRAAER